MKILYVTNMYPTEERLYDGIFVKEQIDYYQKIYKPEYQIFVIDRFKTKLNYLKSIFSINRLIATESWDLIHVHFGLSGLFLLFNPFLKIPVIVTLHGSDIQSYKRKGLLQRISKMVAGRATKIIVLNQNMVNLMKFDQSKLAKIPCGINIEMFDKERKNLHNDNFLIGFPSDKGRPVKNYAFFKKIIDALIKKGFKIEILEFKNFTREQVVENLSRLDCLLMTSLSEGSPQIIKEAMASQIPVITTNVGDVNILLEGVENCYVVNSFSVDDFTEKIIQIINLAPDKRKTNGREKIRQLGFDQHSVCKKIFNLYDTVLRCEEAPVYLHSTPSKV